MFDWRERSEWLQLLRYYIAGLANMLFAFLLFAGLVGLGLNVYVAQAIGYVLGVAFNFVTYSRFTFAGHKAIGRNYIASYFVNYLLGVGLLWLALKLTPSPYLAGLVATIAVSLINYLVLKRFVFKEPATT